MIRKFCLVAVAGLAASVAVGSSTPASARSAKSAHGGTFVPLAGKRVLDTVAGVGGPAHPVRAKHAVRVQIAGRAGVPRSGVGEVAVNVLVSRAHSAGTLVVSPSSGTHSGIAALDFGRHESVSNVVVSRLGSHGTLRLDNHSAGKIAVDVDVLGYYRSGRATQPGSFAGLPRAAVLDSRTGRGVDAGRVHAHKTVSLRVLGRAGVPESGVSAVLLNVGVARPNRSGSVVVYAHRQDRPSASDLHFHAGDPRRTLVYAPVGIDGRVALYNGSAGSLDLHADVTGYVRGVAGLAAGTYSPLPARRLLDTRGHAPLRPGQTRSVRVSGMASLPAAGVAAVAVDLTARGAKTDGALVVYSADDHRPDSSTVHFRQGRDATNLSLVRVGPSQAIKVRNASSRTVDVEVDLRGFFTDGSTGVIRGRIDDTHNTALDGVAVRAVPTNDVPTDRRTRAVTQADGTFAVFGLPADTYYLCAYPDKTVVQPHSATGWVQKCWSLFDDEDAEPITITRGEEAWATFLTLQRGGAVTGEVISDDVPVAGVHVSVETPPGSPVTADTDATGRYLVDGLPAGRYQVCFDPADAVAAPDTGLLPRCTEDVVISAGSTSTINAPLHTGGAIAGAITNASDDPVPDASVEVTSSTEKTYWGGTDTDGNYNLRSLPAGTYTVCVHADRLAVECWDDASPDAELDTVEVAAGTPTTGIDFMLADSTPNASSPTVPVPQPMSTTTDCSQDCGPGSATVRSTTPTLRVAVSDPDGGTVRTWFRIASAPTEQATIGGTLLTSPHTVLPSGVESTQVPSTLNLTNGDIVYWTAWSEDTNGNASALMPWQTLTIDTGHPGLPEVSSPDFPNDVYGVPVGTKGTFRFTSSSDVYEFRWSVNNDFHTVRAVDGSARVHYTAASEGPKYVEVDAFDAAGNVRINNTYQFQVRN